MKSWITRIVKAAFLTSPALFIAVPAISASWNVRPDGALDTLSRAIAVAHSGDSILVHSGVYNESGITIDKPLTIVGIGRPVIDGRETAEIITVRADNVHIMGLEIRNVGVSFVDDRAGIRLAEATGCSVVDNHFINNFFAIYLENAEDCVIENNVIEGNIKRQTEMANGIHLWHCRSITIDGNHISSHRDGIYFEFVEHSTVRNNISENNMRYGLHFMFSHDDTYEGNTFRANGAGVAVMFSDRVEMTSNRFESNWGAASYGLLLKDIRDSFITHNIFHRNTIAIYSEGSMRLDVHHNEFTANGYALRVMASSNDLDFHDNNFIGNTFDVATNSRRNFNSFDGNYWSSYQGYDLDKDGIGDVPYRPVHLFSLLVERDPAGLILLRSFFIDLVDAAERVMPLYTPETLLDSEPLTVPVVLGRVGK